MKLALVHLSTAACPYRLLDDADHEIAWANDFLDAQHLRQLSPRSLRAYAYDLLHFSRWFQSQSQALSEITESTLLDYVRHQLSQQPQPTPQTVNHRLTVIRCLYRFHLGQEIPSSHSHFQRTYATRCPVGYGRPHRNVAFGLRLKQPRRVIQPLSAEQVSRFWASFRTFRDLAVVGLMLLDGLRSCEILSLQLEDLKLADAQLRVLGKGRKQRTVPLPTEIMEVLQSYLRLERPLTNSAYLFISLKGHRRGKPMTPAGLRSLFRHHRLRSLGSSRQSAPISTYVRSRHGASGHLATRPPAPDGAFADSDHHALCRTRAPGRLARICARCRQAHALARDPSENAMKQSRHTLEHIFQTQVDNLSLTLQPFTIVKYQYVARYFVAYLRAEFPEICRLSQLRRDPHMLGFFRWLCQLRPPIGNPTRRQRLLCLRRLLNDLAVQGHQFQPGLIIPEDLPTLPEYLPRPLSPEDDHRLQDELRRKDDLYSNALLLTRLTGIRIGECIHLPLDCLRQIGPEQWALHVPLGKLHTERLVPLDLEGLRILKRIQELRAMASPGRLAKSKDFLLLRVGGRFALFQMLRLALADAAKRAGCTDSKPISPHRLRHTWATELLNCGMGLPALMKLMGHKSIQMTLRYLKVAQPDLQREFYRARQNSTQSYSLPSLSVSTATPDLPGIRQALAATRHLLEMYRRQFSDDKTRRRLQRLDHRLLAITQQLQNIAAPEK